MYQKILFEPNNIWDGDVSTFPSLVVSLRLRSKETKWDANNDIGILAFDNKDIPTDYYSINVAKINAAQTTCINNRAIQSTKDTISRIKASTKGNLKNTIPPKSEIFQNTKMESRCLHN